MDYNSVTDICPKRCQKTIITMNSLQNDAFSLPSTVLDDDVEEFYTSFSDDRFEFPTPPLSPQQGDEDGEFDVETCGIPFEPFDVDTEDLFLFSDECVAEVLKEVGICFPGLHQPANLQSNLIQDIMWSAPTLNNGKVSNSDGQRIRCDSCSNPFNTTCVAPDEVFPIDNNIGGVMSQTHIHNLGIETPSDSEEEIDVVTVEKQLYEKQLHTTFTPNIKREYKCDDSGSESSPNCKSKTLTMIDKKTNIFTHSVQKCATVRQRVDCPTDVHNYSLPVTSLKLIHSYPNSPANDKKKKFKRDLNVPSDLRKVAQKLKTSVVSFSNNSSDSEEFCDAGKRTQHNVLERKRRTDLKNSFLHLRDSVPELEGQVRAPKVVILRKASQYITKLKDEHRKKEKDLELLKLKQEKLRRQLARLNEY